MKYPHFPVAGEMTNFAPEILAMRNITSVVFDLGGVLIDWNPRHLYRKVFDSEEEMEWFLSNICTYEWNVKQDGGRPFRDAIAELTALYPGYSDKIVMYFDRWGEMLGGEVEDTVKIFHELKSAGMPLYALTNWSHEAFPLTHGRFDFLKEFDGIVVSGQEKLLKPDHAIYRVLMERYDIEPEASVYIDDNRDNASAAGELGFHSIHYTSAEQLRAELRSLGLNV